MTVKYSVWSTILIVIGLFLLIEPFSPLNISILNKGSVFVGNGFFAGVIVYFVGLILGLLAFANKEKAFLKFLSLVSFIFIFIGACFLFSFIGQV